MMCTDFAMFRLGSSVAHVLLAGTVKFHLKQFRTPVAQSTGDNILC